MDIVMKGEGSSRQRVLDGIRVPRSDESKDIQYDAVVKLCKQLLEHDGFLGKLEELKRTRDILTNMINKVQINYHSGRNRTVINISVAWEFRGFDNIVVSLNEIIKNKRLMRFIVNEGGINACDMARDIINNDIPPELERRIINFTEHHSLNELMDGSDIDATRLYCFVYDKSGLGKHSSMKSDFREFFGDYDKIKRDTYRKIEYNMQYVDDLTDIYRQLTDAYAHILVLIRMGDK